MSRSFKKVPGFSDNDNHKGHQKRDAAKVVRKTNNIPNGNAYRKLYCSWNICDHNCRIFNKLELEEGIESGWTSPIHKWYMK